LKQAPHPNAAKLWIDFVLSERGQTVLVKGEALISGRAVFRSPLPDYAPALDSLKTIKVDWERISKAKLQKRREEWRRISNQWPPTLRGPGATLCGRARVHNSHGCANRGTHDKMTKRLPVALMGMALLLAPTAVPMSSSLAQAPIG